MDPKLASLGSSCVYFFGMNMPPVSIRDDARP